MASPGSVVIQFQAKADQATREVANLAKKLVGLGDDADDVKGSLDKVQTELNNTGTAAARTVPDMQRAETALDGVGDEAEDTARRLRTEAGQMAGAMHTGATGIESEAGSMKTTLGEVGKESGAEFIGNIAEGIGSGQANLTDIINGTLGGITNLAASLPGIGTAAAVGAAGIGLVFSAVKAQSDKAKQQVQDLIDALDGVAASSDAASKQIVWDTWLADIQKTPGALENIVAGLRAANIEGETFKEAIEGSSTAQAEIKRKMDASYKSIQKNVEETGKITPEQQKQLEHLADIREELAKHGVILDEVQDKQTDIEFLTGKNKKSTSDWADEQERVYRESHKTKKEIDSIPSRKTVKIVVEGHTKNGVPLSKLFPGTVEAQPAAAPQPRAAAPVTINYYASNTGGTLQDARALARLLDRTDIRMGRKPRQPRAQAW